MIWRMGSVALLLTSCASPPEPPAPPAEARTAEALFAADRAFCEAASRDRIDGWVAWFDANAARVPVEGEVTQGTEAIRAADAVVFADPAVELRWEPEVGGLLRADLGFTRGRYELVRTTDERDVVLGTGTYLSIWVWTDEGWRVSLDTGVPDR